MSNETVYRSLTSRATPSEDGTKIEGHFSVFDAPYPIDSKYEGRFIERIAPGAFAETIRTNGDKIRVLFEHGHDAMVGYRTIGKPIELNEDATGAHFVAELYTDASYVRDLLPALRAGDYGTSFGFRVPEGGDTWDEQPERSADNPHGWPERTITRAEVSEFSITLFPANPSATVAVRSITDMYKELPEVITPGHTEDSAEVVETVTEPEVRDVVIPTAESTEVREKEIPVVTDTKGYAKMRIEERRARLTEIETLRTNLFSDDMSDEETAEFDSLTEERAEHQTIVDKHEERRAAVTAAADAGKTEATVERKAPAVHTKSIIHDVHELRASASSEGDYVERARDNAMRIVEAADFRHSDDEARAKSELTEALNSRDYNGALAGRLAGTSSEEYLRSFSKWAAGKYMNPTELRAMSLGVDAEGGFGVPHKLDPTIVFTSARTINPLRGIARVERIVEKTLQLVTSAGITVSRAAADATITPGESDPVARTNATLAREELSTQRVYAYMTKSLELEAGYSTLDSQLLTALAEAKEDEEAASFVTRTGNGLTDLEGMNVLTGTGDETLTWALVYGLDSALPARHRPNAVWVANNTTLNNIRLIDDNVGGDLWTERQGGRPAMINGKDVHELSTLDSVGAAGANPYLIYGDFNKYIVLDRIGMVMKRQDIVVDGSGLPTGETGLVAFWWNGGGFVDTNAFRVLENVV